MGGPTPPQNRSSNTTEDHQSAFAAISAKTPVDEAFRSAFLRNKLLTQPRPGGVGEGFFYTPGFKTNWGLGTSFSCDFVCPASPGGNVNTWLYLTATARSGLGIEAFVSYNGQDTPHFRVFDWARSDAWQTDIPFTLLANYLSTIPAHGYQCPVLSVWNGTWSIGANQYRNQALLYNHARGGWDLVYQYDYAATDAQQKTAWMGSWAPIVETFQSLYAETNQMGALGAQLVSSDNNGVWGSWGPLSPSNLMSQPIMWAST